LDRALRNFLGQIPSQNVLVVVYYNQGLHPADRHCRKYF